MSNRLTQSDMEKVGRMLSHQFGIRVICQGNEAFADLVNRTIYLPNLPDEIEDERLLNLIRYWLDHEVGHMVGETEQACFDAIQKTHGKFGDAVLNNLEDIRCEHTMSSTWAGCDLNIRLGVEALKPMIEKGMTGEPMDDLPVMLYAMTRFDKTDGIFAKATDDTRAIMDKYYQEVSTIPQWAESTRDILDLAQRIAKDMGAEGSGEGDEEKDQGQQGSEGQPQEGGEGSGESSPSKSSGKAGNPSEGDGSSDQRDSGKGDGAGSDDGESQGGGDQGEDQEDQGPDESEGYGGGGASLNGVSKLAAGEIGKEATKKRRKQGEKVGASEPPTDDWDHRKDIELSVKDNYDRTVEEFMSYKVGAGFGQGSEYDKFLHDAKLAGGKISNKLRMILQSEAKTWWRGGQRAGMPDMSKLASLATRTSDRVLARRSEQVAPDTACMLMVDNSGSMRGRDMMVAMQAAYAFCSVLDLSGHKSAVTLFCTGGDALQQACELVEAGKTPPSWVTPGMLDSYEDTDIDDDGNVVKKQVVYLNSGKIADMGFRTNSVEYVDVKTWNQRTLARAPHFHVASVYAQGGTPTYQGIEFGARDIIRRPEKRRVLIVMTDGDCGCFGNRDCTICNGGTASKETNCQKLCKDIEKAGVEVVLIGIGNTNVYNLHSKYVEVKSILDLSAKTMTQLAKALHLTAATHK